MGVCSDTDAILECTTKRQEKAVQYTRHFTACYSSPRRATASVGGSQYLALSQSGPIHLACVRGQAEKETLCSEHWRDGYDPEQNVYT